MKHKSKSDWAQKLKPYYGYFWILLFIVVFLITILVMKLIGDHNTTESMNNRLNGTYAYGEYISCSFDGDGKGTMTINGDGVYKLTYDTSKNEINVDFKGKEVSKVKYKYELDSDKLTLTDVENNSGSYLLTRLDDELEQVSSAPKKSKKK